MNDEDDLRFHEALAVWRRHIERRQRMLYLLDLAWRAATVVVVLMAAGVVMLAAILIVLALFGVQLEGVTP